MSTLTEIAAVFLKLGSIAVGGPAVHVAMMRRELVVTRQWLDDKAFLDGFAACQLIPGPSSTELAIMLGFRRGGLAGLLVAGSCFILPALLLMLLLACLYQHLSSSQLFGHALQGVRPVVVGIIAWAIVDLGRRMLKRPLDAVVALLVLAAGLAGINPIVLLMAAGVASILRHLRRQGVASFLPVVVSSSIVAGSLLATTFLTFLKYGAVSFGSGYVLFAFLQGDVVRGFHWLTTPQLVDAIAISQATPGPVFTVATFIGYLVAGVPGALLATLGIFLPGFLLVPFLDRLMRFVSTRQSVRDFLDGVNLGALGLIAAVTVVLGRASIMDLASAAVALAAFLVLLRLPLAAPGLVLLGAVFGELGLR